MSNLLKDASILLTPTAYENGRMNAIKPSKDLYGSELVTNGDFSNGTNNWTQQLSPNFSVNNGVATIESTGANSLIYQYVNPSSTSAILKIEFDVVSFTGQYFYISFGGYTTQIRKTGKVVIYTSSSRTTNKFDIAPPASTTVVLNNVSVVEDLSGDFNFERNSAATRVNAQGLVENVQILSPELVSNGNFSQIGTEEVLNGNFSQQGSELVTNGDFATDSDWSKSNATISGGKGNLDGDGQTSVLWQDILTNGNSYKATFTISDLNGIGTPKIVNNNGATIYTITNNGTFTINFTHSIANGNFIFRALSGAVFSIDNVSVKEVGQNWTLGSGWSIGDNKAISDGTSSNLDQSGTFLSGKTYKVVYTIEDYVSGDTRFRFTGTSNENGTLRSANGIYTEYITLTNNQQVLRFSGNSFNGSITNISVKEVGQDWQLGTDVAIGDSVVEMNNSAALQGAIQTNVITSGNLCKVSFEVKNYVNGVVNLRHPLNENVSANGVYTFEGTANDTKVFIRGADTTNNFEVTNISVKEITDDTNIPRINYEGFSYQDSLGSEEVVNGDFSNGSANWSTANNPLFENSSVIFENGSRIYQFNVATLGKPYNAEISFSNISGDGITVYWGGGFSKNYSVNDIVNNNNKITENKIHFLSNGHLFIYSKSSNTSATIDNVSVKEYLGQEVVPDSGCGSWLLEPQSTNLVTYSEDFSNSSWIKIGSPTITPNYGTSPDGTQNSTRIQGSSSSYVSTNAMTGAMSGETRSLYVRATSGSGNIQLTSHNSNTNNVFAIDENWQRVQTNSLTSVGGSSWFYIDMRGASTDIYDIEVWAAQGEASSIATSYIPTNGATNTRLQDIATNSGNSSLINSTEGTLYFELNKVNNHTSTRFIGITDNTAYSNRVQMVSFANSSLFRAEFVVGGSSLSIDYTENENIFKKYAITYDVDFVKLYVNGIKIGQIANTVGLPLANTFNSFNFGRKGGTQPFFGKAKALAVYKEALTDANLRCLTYPNPVATTFDLDFDTIAEQFTFTRGSEATFVNEQGLIESTNQIGPELVTNGDFATDSDWLKGTGWSIANGKASCDGTQTYWSILRQDNILPPNGSIVKIVATISNYSSGILYLKAGYSETGLAISSNGTFTTYRVVNGSSQFRVQADLNFIGSVDNVSVKEVTTATNTPRIDYSTGEKAFLLEPQSTNLIPYSNYITSINNVTASYNATESPSGELNAPIFTATSTDPFVRSSTFSITTGNTYTMSFYIKGFGTSVGKTCAASATTLGGTTFTLTDSWQRISYSGVSTSTRTNAQLRIDAPNVGVVVGEQFSVWGLQVENQSYSTSYIPTDGAIATRNQELCNNATPVINSEEGTLYAEISALDDGNIYKLLEINNGGITDRVYIAYRNNLVYVSVIVGGVQQFLKSTSTSITSVTNFNKIAVKYKENDFALWVNGVEVGTDANGITSANGVLNSIDFSNSSNGIPFHGNTKGLKYYPKALADAQLEDLTTI